MGLGPIVSDEQQPASSLDDQHASSHGGDLLRPNGSVLTGTTSHQHYPPPHHLPGHDLVIDLNWASANESSPAAGSDNSIPSRVAAAVPLGPMVPVLDWHSEAG